MLPVVSATAQKLSEKSVAYTYDEKTSIEYSLTYTGFKEDIVVSEYTGQTEYDFTLRTGGLKLVEKNGSYALTDGDGNIKATLGDIIVFTADERNNTMGRLSAKTVTECEEYTVTIILDADYLADEKTVYPIRIDPTVEITYENNGAGAIQDITLNSLTDSDGASWSLTVGKRATYGTSRVLMKFPGLNLSSLGSNAVIQSASVEIRDLMCEGTEMEMSCHPFFGNVWNEVDSEWANVNPNGYGAAMSTNVISFNNGYALPTHFRYSFDITAAVQDWRLNPSNQNKGIIFKASNAIENGSTYNSRTFASYNRSEYRPSFSMTYTNDTPGGVFNGTYFLNNESSGNFLRGNVSGVLSAQSGLLSQLGNTIKWEIVPVNGGYVIRSVANSKKYLGVTQSSGTLNMSVPQSPLAGGSIAEPNGPVLPDLGEPKPELITVDNTLVPDSCVWIISKAAGGEFVIINKSTFFYLYVSNGYLGLTTGPSNDTIWRIVAIRVYGKVGTGTYYNELESFSINDAYISLGQPVEPKYISTVSKPLWASPSDFEYSYNENYVINRQTGTLIGASEGQCTVKATHKVTKRECTFTVYVTDTLICDSCLIGTQKNIKSSVGNNCSALSEGVTWKSSDPNIATVDSSGYVTGVSSGYCFITAKNSSGKIILECEFKVTDARTEKLAAFEDNEIQYLYCPTTTLSGWTKNLENQFDFKVDLLYCLMPYYRRPVSEHPDANELKTILKNELNFDLKPDEAQWIFYECYLGYCGQYNPEYLNRLRQEYFNTLKQIVVFCAFGMARNLDPVNTLSDCNGVNALAEDLSDRWTHNRESKNVMLGSDGWKGKFYYEEAEKYGYRYFYSPEYDSYRIRVGDEVVKSANMNFLDKCISDGCTFYFSHDAERAKHSTSLYKEYSYLNDYYTQKWGSAKFVKNGNGLYHFIRG